MRRFESSRPNQFPVLAWRQGECGVSASLPNEVSERVAVLEEIARGTRAVLERLEKRLDGMDARLDRMDGRLDRIVSDQRSDFRWVVGILFGGFGTVLASYLGLLGVMAHGFNWL